METQHVIFGNEDKTVFLGYNSEYSPEYFLTENMCEAGIFNIEMPFDNYSLGHLLRDGIDIDLLHPYQITLD